MKKGWRPNASQKKAFIEKMKDPEEQHAYNMRVIERGKYENWKDKDFIPTKEQHDFCFNNMELFVTSEEKDAMNFVMSAYAMNEKVGHEYIHIVNEKRRNSN